MDDPTNALHELRAARARGYCLELDAYCRGPECPARDVTIRVKDYGRTLLATLEERGGLHCPVCGAMLGLHSAVTFAEADRAQRLVARGSVAAEMYQRDHGLGYVPASLFGDTRLPPTPPGWWTEIEHGIPLDPATRRRWTW